MSDPQLPDDDAPDAANENEIMAAAKAAKKRNAAVAKLSEPGQAGHWPLQAIGIGVGSAALAAALLWVKSTRDRK